MRIKLERIFELSKLFLTLQHGKQIAPYEWILKTNWTLKQELVWYNMKEETPVKVLCKQINFYLSFIEKLKTKDGIDKDAPQEKLDKLICECEEKIKEFETAIKILDPTAKCEQALVKSSADY